VSESHLDESVKSGIPQEFYRELRMLRLAKRRAFLQLGGIRPALAAQTTVVDLNPRSLSAWFLLIGRRLLGRRTLAWGHIHPQAGPASRTAKLRLLMRRISAGTISYTYRDEAKAKQDLPGQAVWTAPNSLYREDGIAPAISESAMRNEILYVGRFAEAKKVSLLVHGFAMASRLDPAIRLTLVGGGTEEGKLRDLVTELGILDKVSFPGWIDDREELIPFYGRAFCSASPGFAGLGLTQSLGFGVPMLVAKDEPHSPEIELEESGGVHFFASDSATSLADAIIASASQKDQLPFMHLSRYTKDRYSAEAMANGLIAALKGEMPDALAQRSYK
jgi:glycosyltransferase involved in cell wall biosynthesis